MFVTYNAPVSDIEIESIQELNDAPTNDANIHAIDTENNKTKTRIDFDLKNSDLTQEQKQKLFTFLNGNRDVFATSLSELGHSKIYKHKIETYRDAKPVKRPFYHQSPPVEKEISRHVEEMERHKLIKPSNSEYHSPVVLVKKKQSGQWRFCCDYRLLNKQTVPMSFPLPRLECVFDTLGESQANIFSSLDLYSGFHQIEMDEETRHKSAFITRNGVYEWLRQLDSQGREHVIAYGGRSLSRAERIWCTTEQECLAVLEGVKHFRAYLTRRFRIFTDHKALKYLMDQKVAVGKLGRWALKLQDFDFDIVHKPGKNNEVADALSRRTYTEVADENKTSPVKVFVANANENEFLSDTIEVNACETDLEVDNKGDEDLESVELELFYGDYTLLAPLDPEVVNSELLDIPAVGQLQQVDPDFQDMFNYLQNDVLPQSEKVRQKVLAESQDYSVCDGVLYKWFQKRFKTSPDEKYIKQLCLPLALRRHALLAYHDLNYGGAHLGLDRVLAALRQKYFWPKMHQTVKDHVLSCDRCQRIKVDHTRKNPPLNPLPVVGPFDRWHMDFLKLSKTNKGETYLLVLVDSCSKWVEAFAMKTQEASEVAKVLFKEVFSRFGAARFLVSDRGKSFMNNLVLSLCEIFDVTRYHTSLYHPQTNGAYCDQAQNNWPDKLPGILMALRNSPSTQSTEFSPFHLLFGREMNLPFDTSVTPKQNLSSDAKLQMEEVLSNLKITQDLATKNMLEKQLKSKERYDRNSKIPQFKVRDLVLLRQHVVPVGRSPKLVDKYKGPYYITELGPKYTYKLRMCSTNKEVKSMINAKEIILYKDPRDHQLQPNEVVQNQANDADRVDQHDQSDENVPQAQNRENETTDGNDDQVEDHQFYKAEKLLKLKRLQGRRHFLVKWADGSQPTWEPEEYVSEHLIRVYFSTHTNTGAKRKRKTCIRQN
ncbi:unnamed protein product [Mytilus edulis]|uniref:Transposon Ty3-I Gag-Pol polyprotein n=1 Tax=Mytilus edulis TaxID=6550 RepID=A0A8S3RPA7_MYTED|nr:unnamed protein product [Mytilus edulis]